MSDDELDRAVAAVARGVRARAAQLGRAEEQLAAFAWREDAGGTGAPVSDDADRSFLAPMTLRALRAALAPDAWPFLRGLTQDGDATVSVLAERMGAERLAAVDRIGAWSQAGLVGRDLETDRVGVTELGGGIVRLIERVTLVAQGENGS